MVRCELHRAQAVRNLSSRELNTPARYHWGRMAPAVITGVSIPVFVGVLLYLIKLSEPADRVPLSVGALLYAATGAAMVYKDLPYLSSQTDVFIATNQRLVIRTVRRHDLLHSPLHVRTGI